MMAADTPSATDTRQVDTTQNDEAAARLFASHGRTLLTRNPTSEWIGGEWQEIKNAPNA